MGKRLTKVFEPLTSIVLAFLVGSLMILLIGESPLNTFKLMFTGAFGSSVNITNTLLKTTTLSLSGLSYAFAYRCGLEEAAVAAEANETMQKFMCDFA